MPLIVTEGDSKPKQLPPAGTHVGRCYSVIDLGTQDTNFGSKRRVRITWELPEELAVFDAEKGEQPFVVSKEYTLSLFEKANLRHDLEAWRGKEFSEEEKKGFDIFTLIGVPCMLTLVHKTTQNGKTFANVQGIGKLARGVTCPAQVNPSVQYDIFEGRTKVFETLPQWLRDKIESAEEWVEFDTPEPPPPDDNGDTTPPF